MTGFEVDPDSLSAAAALAERQHGHLSTTAGYVDHVCGRTGAFSGVLNLFRGSYEQTLQHARQGLTDSQTVAGKVRDSMTGSREAYLTQDRHVYATFEKARAPARTTTTSRCRSSARSTGAPPSRTPGTRAARPSPPCAP